MLMGRQSTDVIADKNRKGRNGARGAELLYTVEAKSVFQTRLSRISSVILSVTTKKIAKQFI